MARPGSANARVWRMHIFAPRSPLQAHQASCRPCPGRTTSLDPGPPSRWARSLTATNQHLRQATLESVCGSRPLRAFHHSRPTPAIHHRGLACGPGALLTSFDARCSTCCLLNESQSSRVLPRTAPGSAPAIRLTDRSCLRRCRLFVHLCDKFTRNTPDEVRMSR